MPQLVRLHLPLAVAQQVPPSAAPSDPARPGAGPVALEPAPSASRLAPPPSSETAAACPAIRARTAALREGLAQAGGALAGSSLRRALVAGGTAATWAGGALVATGLVAAGWQAASLAQRALAGVRGTEGRAAWACRLGLAAAPLVLAGAATLALGSGQVGAAVALFAGGFVERGLRDLASHGLATWLPRAEAAHPAGEPLPADLRAHIEWARARYAMPRTGLCTALQVGLSRPLAQALGGGSGWHQAVYVAGTTALEAARAVIGHQATEQLARHNGLELRPQAGRGASAALARARDVFSMRQSLAVSSEVVQLLAGTPSTPASAATALGASLFLGSLKGLGEVRSALVNLGRGAGQAPPDLRPVPPPA